MTEVVARTRLNRAPDYAVLGAAIIALLAWAAFADHVRLNTQREGGVMLAGLWRQLRYFTETTNIYVAVLFSWIALRGPAVASRQKLGGLVLSVALVAIIYWGILYSYQQSRTLWDQVFNVLIHGAIPAAVIAYYFTCATRTPLTRSDCVRWTLYPLAYLVYGLARGLLDGRYPYFFLDPGRIGVTNVAFSVIAIAILFITAGSALIAWEQRQKVQRAG